MSKGIFIAFEGIDGSGKSTQIQLLNEKIKEKGIRCYQTCEPSSGPIGSLTRQILTGRIKTDNRVIAAMFAADRLDHLLNDVDGIAKKVEDGITVITDRYYFSSYAYSSAFVRIYLRPVVGTCRWRAGAFGAFPHILYAAYLSHGNSHGV